MLKTWVGTRVVGTNILDHSVWAYVLRFSGSGMPHICLANRISFSFFFFYTSTVPWSFLCLQFLSFDSLTSRKVPELWENNGLLLCPLAVTVDSIVSAGNMGLGRNHSHTATPADEHSFWRGSQMLLQVLWGLRQSERVIDGVSERLSSVTTKREGRRPFAQTSFPLSGQTALKKRGLSLSFGLQKVCQNRLNCQMLSQERKLLSEEFNLGTAIYSILRPLMDRNFFCFCVKFMFRLRSLASKDLFLTLSYFAYPKLTNPVRLWFGKNSNKKHQQFGGECLEWANVVCMWFHSDFGLQQKLWLISYPGGI